VALSVAAPVLRAVVADDEDGARRHLRELLSSCRVNTVAECESGDAVEDAVRRARADVAYLDVRMPGLDGMEAARALVRRRGTGASPAVVFTTGFADYAVRAFEVGAVDYLLKPLSPARVREAVERVRARLSVDGADRELSRAANVPAAVSPRIFVPSGDHCIAVAPEHIRFVEARGRASVIHTDFGRHALRVSLGTIDRALIGHGFLRTHRAYVVNVRRVRALVPWSRDAYSLLLDGGEETHVPVAKSRLTVLRESVIWISGAGGYRGSRASGQSRARSGGQQGIGPRDRPGAGG
jgi:DNA-binding LytR/AlgR family response regulator